MGDCVTMAMAMFRAHSALGIRLSEYAYLNKQMMQTHTTNTRSASRAAPPPATPITIPRGMLAGVASGLAVDLGVVRTPVVARGTGLGVATVLVMTSGWIVVAGRIVVGLVVTLRQSVSLVIPVLK